MRNLVLPIVMMLISLGGFAQTKSILFVGNSYTHCNDGVDKMLVSLAASKGIEIYAESSAIGGYSLQRHCSNQQTLSKIKSKAWDYVVLQELSTNPCYPPEVVDTLTYPYAKILSDMVHDNNYCTQLMFYMTWGRKNGYISDTTYMPLTTFNGMQKRLAESYCEMAADNDGAVAPVGMAWKYVRDNYPEINLYTEDKSHPSPQGTYLAACVFYASIFKESPEGASYTYGLPQSEAAILQQAASVVVFRSMAEWRLDQKPRCEEYANGKRNRASFANIVIDGKLQFDRNIIVDYSIYTYTGRLCKQGTLHGDSIDVSDFRSGLYLIKLADGETQKFVVE